MSSKDLEKVQSMDTSMRNFKNRKTFSETLLKRKELMKDIPQVLFDKIVFALNTIKALLAHRNGQKIFLSFNGGKDCLAAYILLKFYIYCRQCNLDYANIQTYQAFTQTFQNSQDLHYDITLVYFINSNNFQEEEDFVMNFTREENCDIVFLYSGYVPGLHFLTQHYGLDMIFMGTRKDDIKSDQRHRVANSLAQPSTPPYQEFLRVYPVFHFNYEEVWRVILSSGVKYLELYDIGYSSIGNKYNTNVNKHLQIAEGSVLPAWCLEEHVTERDFRFEKGENKEAEKEASFS